MESESEQEAETAWVAEAPFGNVDSTNVEQRPKREVTAWVRRQWRRCKEWFLQPKHCHRCLFFGVVVVVVAVVVLVIVFAQKTETSHHGKFPLEWCPSEWIGYKRKCYFISEEEKNWTSSQTFCINNESLLVVFENQEEMHSLAKRLKIDEYWIGLSKKGESFYWENGVAFKGDLFQMRNHSECACLDAFTISTSACSLPRRWICIQLP